MKNFCTILLIVFVFSFNLSYSQCTITNSIECECEDPTQNSCDLLPDITVSWQTGINGSEEFPPGEGLQDGEINYPENWFEITPEVQEMGRIRVSARTPNIGVGPLNLRGVDKDGFRWMICFDSGVADTFQVYDPEWNEESYCPNGSSPKHISWQRVYQKKADGSMTFYEQMVGTVEYHPTHGHMHFDEWTIMSLRKIDEDNMENPYEWPIIGEGAKVGFCVMDLGNCSDESAGCRDDESIYSEGELLSQDDFPNYGLGGGSYSCSPLSQGISSGYNDTYGSYLDGMFLNIPLGTCNGDYAVVLEVPQVMVESRLDNNFTWFPITLTQQSDGPDVQDIVSSVDGLICDGDIVNLSIEAPNNSTISWFDGSSLESVEINEGGKYSVTITSPEYNCPTIKTINISSIPNPMVSGVTICKNESADLSVDSDFLVKWYDEDMNVVGNGNNFTTPAINQNVTYYVSNSFLNNKVGPEVHEGGSDEYSSGDNSVGFLSFDALNDFTLESVNVYTNEPGERRFVLMNELGEVIAEHTEFVVFCDNEPQTIMLNFNVPAGNNYQIGTDVSINEANYSGQNPQLKRTGNNGGLNYPYVIEGSVSINKAVYYGQGLDGGSDDYTNYYYYLYDWVIDVDAVECNAIPVPIIIEDCSTIDELVVEMNVYPNPSEGIITIDLSLEKSSEVSIILTNSIGQIVYSEMVGKISNLDKSYNWTGLPKGVYTIDISVNNSSKFEKVVLQ